MTEAEQKTHLLNNLSAMINNTNFNKKNMIASLNSNLNDIFNIDTFSTTAATDFLLVNNISHEMVGNVTVDVNISSMESFYPLLGPQRDPLYIVIPITIVYLLIFFTGIIGNVSTCIVIGRNRTMHTATNYYLFSLAISDLLLLITGLPQEVYFLWSRYPYIFGEVFCIVRGLAAETSTNATVLTITAFTVERYIAICRPFLSHTMSKLSRAIKLILMIWCFSLVIALPQALQFGVFPPFPNHPELVMCMQKTVIFKRSFEMHTLFLFVIPMTVITVLYVLIGMRLRHSNMMKKESCTSNTSAMSSSANNIGNTSKRGKMFQCKSQAQSSRRVVKMLVAVVIAFFLCWAPFHAQRLVAIYAPPQIPTHNSGESQQKKSKTAILYLYEVVTYSSGVLYYISTIINPILYHLMSNKFRNAFKDTFTQCCCCCLARRNRHMMQRSYSALSSQHPQQRVGAPLSPIPLPPIATTNDQSSISGNENESSSINDSLMVRIGANHRRQSKSIGEYDYNFNGENRRQRCGRRDSNSSAKSYEFKEKFIFKQRINSQHDINTANHFQHRHRKMSQETDEIPNDDSSNDYSTSSTHFNGLYRQSSFITVHPSGHTSNSSINTALNSSSTQITTLSIRPTKTNKKKKKLQQTKSSKHLLPISHEQQPSVIRMRYNQPLYQIHTNQHHRASSFWSRLLKLLNLNSENNSSKIDKKVSINNCDTRSPCNISNSSLRDVECGALEDELTTYMQQLQNKHYIQQ